MNTIRRAVWTGALTGMVAGLLTVPAGPSAADDATYIDVAQQVADINPSGQSSPGNLTAFGGSVYFTAYTPASGRELWRSDGTAAGTVQVRDIEPGTGSGNAEHITVAGGKLFFSSDDGSHGFELWVSDGTEAGTRMVADTRPGAASSSPHGFTAIGDAVIYAARDEEHGTELWRSDGTPEGTWLVKDIVDTTYTGFDGTIHPHSSEPDRFVEAGGVVYFMASAATFGYELWRTDGTEAGTYLVHDINAGGSSSEPYGLTAIGDALYYSAQTRDEGREVWRTVLPSEETGLVKDVNPGETWDGHPLHGAGGTPHFTGLNGAVLFYGADEDHGRELWATDGSPEGTRLVRDVIPGAGDGAGLGDEPGAVLGDSLFYPGTSTDHGTELWRSDGTSEGTQLVGDLFAGSFGAHPQGFAAWQDSVYFSADDGTAAGRELWRTDGTEAGTMMVQDLYPGLTQGLPNRGAPQQLTAVGDTLFFTAESADGHELWKLTREAVPTDTTAPETTIIAGPSGTTAATTAELGFVADEEGSTFECRLDDGAWAACTSPATVTGLTDGQHEFWVRATDAAGNTDQTPASRSFTVDTAAPGTTITSGPAGVTSAATVELGFGADELGSTFECRLDGQAWAACTSPETLAALGEGEHLFEVRATDPAGNTDPTPASRSFVVDTTAPETTITSGSRGATPETTAEFAFEADEEGSTFECRLDAGVWAGCTSPQTVSDLGEGDHEFRVRATDAAGNTDPTPALRAFTVEPAVPPGPTEACREARADLRHMKERLATVKTKLDKVKAALRNARDNGAGPAKMQKLKKRKNRLQRRVENLKEKRAVLKDVVAAECG